MKIGLRTKLIAAFLIVTLTMVALVSLLANNFLSNQFQAYAIDKQQQQISSLVELLTSRYVDWGNRWDAAGIETIGVNTLGQGMMLRLHDQQGSVLWDAQVHNNGMCSTMLANYAQTMQAQNINFQGGYVEESYPINVDRQQVGSVDIGYYGPYFYSTADVQFLKTLNQLLLLAAFIAMLISVALGIILARQLTRPITSVIATAQQIAGGKYIDRISAKSNTREIVELTTSINSLGATLGQQENLRKQLTADVAHELRTPLTILQSHLEAMIDGTFAADQTRLENCHAEVVRISKLVGDMEKLTEMDQDNLTLNRARLDLAALLQRVVDNFQSQFASQQVKLTLTASPEFIEGDEDKLSQVMINLLANALKYTPAGGKVEVVLTSDPQQVSVAVSDTGTGISPADLPNIFERFYRTDKSRTRSTGGAGIGLTIVKSIIDAHNGAIDVISTLGQGSQFTITLPRA